MTEPKKASPTVTYSLIALCLLVAMMTNLSHSPKISDFLIIDPKNEQWVGIWKTQWWRLVTPIFLHFSWAHLIFNVINLYTFGVMIEKIKGNLFFLLMVLVMACVSNVAEFYIGKTFAFGGISGVLYGLFGYLWIKGRFDPAFSDVRLSSSTVWMMLLWLGMCWTGYLGSVANVAHLSGLIVGVLLGFII